MIDVPAI